MNQFTIKLRRINDCIQNIDGKFIDMPTAPSINLTVQPTSKIPNNTDIKITVDYSVIEQMIKI